MNKILFRSVLRDIRRNFGRFFSIFAIVAIGVGFFAGVKAGEPDMLDSSDAYYTRQKLMDIRIVAVNGFSESDVKLISEQIDCTAVASYSVDSVVKNGENLEFVASFHSYSDKVNVPVITEGRLPKTDKECIVDANSLNNDIDVGDTLSIIGEDTKLKHGSYTVVGKFISPMYISAANHGTTNLGNGTVSTAVYVKDSGFNMKRYNQMYLYLDFLHDDESCYSEDYKNAVKGVKDRLKALCIRQMGYISSGSVDLREAGLDVINAELGEQIDLLYQMRDEIESARQQLVENKKQIDALGVMIDSCRSEFELASIDVEHGQSYLDKEYKQGLTEIHNAQTALNELKLALSAKITARDTALKAYNDKKATLDSLEPESAEYSAIAAEVAQLKAAADEAAGEVTKTENSIADSTAALEKLKAAYAAKHENNQADYETLLSTKIESLEQYEAAKQAYEKAYFEYETASSAYMTQAAAVNSAIDELLVSVNNVFNEVETLWHTFDRTQLPAYSEYEDNAERIGNIGKIFPAFFLLVAALVCLTAMTRAVDEQRTQIGVLKALGYSNSAILAQYMIYSLSAAVLGCAFGCVVGFKLFPGVIINAYTMLYTIPVTVLPFRWGLALWSSALMIACIGLTVFFACYREFVNMPAELVRPKSAPAGKRILLERIGFIWKRMSFIKKVTARNIFRYKKRMLMTVIGIAGCTALVLTGFGLRDSITDIVNLQFNKIWKYDATVAVSNADAAKDVLTGLTGADSYIETYQKACTAKANDKTCDINIVAVSDSERLSEFITLADRVSGDKATLTGTGAVITEKAAKLLSVSVGDTLALASDNDEFGTVTVSAISENYAYNYIYMTTETAQKLVGEAKTNMLLCKLGKTDADEFSKAALKSEHVDAVMLNSTTEDTLTDIMEILDLVVFVLIISAAALAFVVLFSLANINIAERRREIATLKVLGFTRAEVNAYVFRENLVLTAIGAVVGLALGYVLAMFVIVTAEIDMVMFGRTIYWFSFAISFVITMAFSLIVSLLMNRKLDKIDMVESLKSVE